MKLEESNEFYSSKRKWEFEHTDRKSKRSLCNPTTTCDIDVLQARIRAVRTNQVTTSEKLRARHAVTYPINCDPIDGITPNNYVMQVRRTSCSRCLQGEAGHFRHMQQQ